MAVVVADDVLGEQVDELGALWTRANHAHPAAQDIEEGRQRVQRGAPQQAAHRSATIRALDATRRCVASKQTVDRTPLCPLWRTHGAKLIKIEDLAVSAYATLPVEHRPRRAELHRQRYCSQQRRQKHDQRPGEDAVAPVLERELHALWIHSPEGEQRQAADWVVGDAAVDRVEHPRHYRDFDAQLLGALARGWDA